MSCSVEQVVFVTMLFRGMSSGGNVKGSSMENFVNVRFLTDEQYTEYWQSFVQWDECWTKT